MICKECGNEYDQWYKSGGLLNPPENNLCQECNHKAWEKWEIEHVDELAQISTLQQGGHTHHCACRQVWGDGECECNLYEKGYDPYWWMKPNKATPPDPQKAGPSSGRWPAR